MSKHQHLHSEVQRYFLTVITFYAMPVKYSWYRETYSAWRSLQQIAICIRWFVFSRNLYMF